MSPVLQNLFSRFNSLSSQPATRQLSLLVGLAASIALGVGMVQWAAVPEFVPLYGELSPLATTEVIGSLDSKGIKYQLDNRTGLVSVHADRLHEARLQLASEGLPESDAGGFDVLYKEQQMGISSFIEKARYDRALEQELAKSIASLESVKAARVHLALPRQSAFVRRQSKPAASVLLSLYAGRRLTDRQLSGVVFMVASSVPGLSAEHVSVVDNQGKLLSSQGSEDGFSRTKEQFRFTRELEQSYVDRINEILLPILGVDAFRAQVAADVDYTIVERTSESYAPENRGSIRSEQLVEELTDGARAAGIPGTLSNEPPRNAAVSAEAPDLAETREFGQNAAPTRSSKKEVRNYELDKTISHVREVPGDLRKLSVAVVVDYRTQVSAEGENERVPLSEQQLAEVNSLVREAVGFSEQRGDTVNVVSASFVAAPQFDDMPGPSLLERDWVWKVVKVAVAGVGLLVLVFAVLRPMVQAGAPPPEHAQPQLAAPEEHPGLPAATRTEDGLPLGEDQVTLGQQQLVELPASVPAYQQQLSEARSLVANEPERVAHVVKNWVAADG